MTARWLVIVAATCAACGYPEPIDVCDGDCQVLAIDRAITTGNLPLTLEGTFEDGTLINFPNGHMAQVRRPVSHRAIQVQTLPDPAAGVITLTSRTPSHGGVPFRRTNFDLGLRPFNDHYDQAGVARVIGALSRRRNGTTAVRAGRRLYLIGGLEQTTPLATIETAVVHADGMLGAFELSTTSLHHPRSFATVTVIGKYIYVVGGLGSGGALDSVERAEIMADGGLGEFAVVPGVTLDRARGAHASAIIGNALYVFGGSSDGALASVERAAIHSGEELGDFERLDYDIGARAGLTATVFDENVFLIGGSDGSQPLASIVRLPITPEGHLDSPRAGGSMVDPRAFHSAAVLGSSIYLIGGNGTGGSVATIERADNLGASLTFEPADAALTVPRQGHASVVIDNAIFVIGGARTTPSGLEGSFPVERAQIIDFGNVDSFTTQVQQLTTPRSHHVTVVIGNSLYVIGGHNDAGALGTVERATIAPDGTISEFAPYPSAVLAEARWGHSALVVGDRLYITGGNVGATTSRSTEVAPINADGTLGAFASNPYQLGTGRAFHTAVVAGGCIYIIGGSTSGAALTSVEVGTVDDMKRLSFTPGAALATPRKESKAIVLGRNVYLVAGRDDSTELGILRGSFDNCAVNWSTTGTASMLYPRWGHTVVNVGRTLYIVGGSDGGAGPPIERSTIAADGAFSGFSNASSTMPVSKSGHTATVIGDYIYLIGGTIGGAFSDEIERATWR